MEDNNWNVARCTASRAKRSDSGTRTPAHRTRHPRSDTLNMARSPTLIDDVTLNAMINSGMMDTLGPIHFAQFRVPVRQPIEHVNPIETIEPQMEYTVGWTPKNVNVSSHSKKAKEDPSKFKSPETHPLDYFTQEEEPPKKDSRFLLPKIIMAEGGPPPEESISNKRQESLMQWFDRTVEKELKTRRDRSSDEDLPTNFADSIMPAKDFNFPKSVLDKMSEASASRIETVSQMLMVPDTELSDVVDKYAKAEAMCAFAGAIKAAEAAAEAAPPELAEEAALASARIYQSEMNATEVKEEFQGIKPMEVVGYIGITKPKYPVRPERR